MFFQWASSQPESHFCNTLNSEEGAFGVCVGGMGLLPDKGPTAMDADDTGTGASIITRQY